MQRFPSAAFPWTTTRFLLPRRRVPRPPETPAGTVRST